MRLYHDPHYKPDRDHKKILADNRRHEVRMAELQASLKWIATRVGSEQDTRPPEEIFSTLRIAAKRVALTLRHKVHGKPKKSAKAVKRAQNDPKRDKKSEKLRVALGEADRQQARDSKSVPDTSATHRLNMLIAESELLQNKIESLGKAFAEEPIERRKALLGTRLSHLRAKRSAAYEEMHAIGSDVLSELEATQRRASVATAEANRRDKDDLLNPNKRVNRAPVGRPSSS